MSATRAETKCWIGLGSWNAAARTIGFLTKGHDTQERERVDALETAIEPPSKKPRATGYPLGRPSPLPDAGTGVNQPIAATAARQPEKT
jgi:hypothetical protein